MTTFFTVTNSETTHTNSRSERFVTVDAAIHEAKTRIQSGRANSVVILQAIKLVRCRPQPEIEVVEI